MKENNLIKKLFYLFSGICFGILFSNTAILPYAIFIWIFTIILEFVL